MASVIPPASAKPARPKREDYAPGDAGTREFDKADGAWQKKRDAALPKAHTGSQNTGRSAAEIVEQNRVTALNAKLAGTEPEKPKPAPVAAGGDARPAAPGPEAGLAEQAKYQKDLRDWQRRQAAAGLKAGKQAEAIK